ncbi:MAG: TIGR03943 family putative permease subunit [Thainema sp.]
MLKNFPLLQNLTQFVTGKEPPQDEPAIDIWSYAEPAGEEPDPLRRNVLQWRRLITSVREPVEDFPGQPVDIIGFVHRPLPPMPNQFVLARRMIRCCLADTVPLGLAIATDTADAFPADQWLRVQGKFGTAFYRNHLTLVVIPDTITPIEEPQKAYINGVF